jgi:hypothetical protein
MEGPMSLVVSDDHPKYTVFSYNTAILKACNDNTNTPVTKFRIFSDGTGSQFKKQV